MSTDYPSPPDWDIGDAFIRFIRGGSDSDLWAWDYLNVLAGADSHRALRILRRVMAEELSALEISVIGAGPLEVVVCIAAGDWEESPVVLDEVLELAGALPNFKAALENVWPGPGESEQSWNRIDDFLGTSVHERHPPRQ